MRLSFRFALPFYCRQEIVRNPCRICSPVHGSSAEISSGKSYCLKFHHENSCLEDSFPGDEILGREPSVVPTGYELSLMSSLPSPFPRAIHRGILVDLYGMSSRRYGRSLHPQHVDISEHYKNLVLNILNVYIK